jgi:hypothetical protein
MLGQRSMQVSRQVQQQFCALTPGKSFSLNSRHLSSRSSSSRHSKQQMQQGLQRMQQLQSSRLLREYTVIIEHACLVMLPARLCHSRCICMHVYTAATHPSTTIVVALARMHVVYVPPQHFGVRIQHPLCSAIIVAATIGI